jgi:hypothetical protein
MRLKPDGTLDLDWQKQPSRLWGLTKEERDEELLNSGCIPDLCGFLR